MSDRVIGFRHQLRLDESDQECELGHVVMLIRAHHRNRPILSTGTEYVGDLDNLDIIAPGALRQSLRRRRQAKSSFHGREPVALRGLRQCTGRNSTE